MTYRQDVSERVVVNGVPFIVTLISNPTIDDVVVTEARLHAATLEGYSVPENRKVEREIKDFLVRLGVDR